MEPMRPVVISVGGWDPCAGAGLAADIKTFEMGGTTGMGICSAMTIQTHHRFHSLQWCDAAMISSQLRPLLETYPVKALKFGIMPDMETMLGVISELHSAHPKASVIWDPVLKASAGFTFHQQITESLLHELLKQVTLVTPNLPEAKILFGDQSSNTVALQQQIHKQGWGAILLKGGHAVNHANDLLVMSNDIVELPGKRFETNTAKHGSGCVLSAAITANLAKGLSLSDSCRMAKQYVEGFLQSAPQMLGYHSQIEL
ncbi:MAG: hydroxymethylpyrimidine/phosphomethylpyrimidine kinase [Marinilabiliaceae bacterium]|nr:hydroxymethylpyrimidine/phosphomethylpyrimidine kinase [Marinilabiliaceae bacterium]